MKSSNKQYGKRLLILAFPIIMNNIIAQLQMIIDRIFLGHANDLYMSALGNVSSPVWTTMSFCNSLVMGASILISQSVGAKKREDIGEYAGAMLKYNNIIPIFLCFFWMIFPKPVFMILGVSDNVMPLCLGYVRWYAPLFLLTGLGGSLGVILQTSNYTKPLVVYGCVRSGFNIFLDWMLIFGNLGMPALGIEGAAIATVIAEYVGAIYISVIFFTSKRLPTRPSWNDVKKGHFQSYLNAAKLGINIALEDFAWNIGNLMELDGQIVKKSDTIDEYSQKVEKIKNYIKEGHIFQTVLSQRWTVKTKQTGFNLYEKLRKLNPSPYLYYYNFGDFEIIGSSPEMIVKQTDSKVYTCPIAGTRRRGKTKEEDIALEERAS